jgi:YHS domain-containing protein
MAKKVKKKKVAKKAKKTVKKTVKKKVKKVVRKAVKKKVKAKKPVKKKAKAKKAKKVKKAVKKKPKTVKRKKRLVPVIPRKGMPEIEREIISPSDELPLMKKGRGAPVEEGELVEKTSENLYDSQERENMLDEESLKDYEAGFMEGYENPDLIQCDHCGKNVELAHVIEWDVEGTAHWFCSEECLEKFLKKKQEEML